MNTINGEITLSITDIFYQQLLRQKEIDSGKEVISKDYNQQETPLNSKVKSNSNIELKIIETINKYVRPAVEMDGGAIVFKSYNNGVVSLLLQGACSGCPSASITLKAGIEELLKKFIPEVKEVVQVED